MRSAQLLRYQLRPRTVFDDQAPAGSRGELECIELDCRSLLVGPGPDSLATVAAAERSGREFELHSRRCDAALPLYLRRDGLSLEGSRAILEHFVMTTSRVAFRPPVGSPVASQLVQWLDWIEHAVAVPMKLERSFAHHADIEPGIRAALVARVAAALEKRAEEIVRGEFLVGSHLTIADLYLWACLELFPGSCPEPLFDYRHAIRDGADLGPALTRFRLAVQKGSAEARSAVEPPR